MSIISSFLIFFQHLDFRLLTDFFNRKERKGSHKVRKVIFFEHLVFNLVS